MQNLFQEDYDYLIVVVNLQIDETRYHQYNKYMHFGYFICLFFPQSARLPHPEGWRTGLSLGFAMILILFVYDFCGEE